MVNVSAVSGGTQVSLVKNGLGIGGIFCAAPSDAKTGNFGEIQLSTSPVAFSQCLLFTFHRIRVTFCRGPEPRFKV